MSVKISIRTLALMIVLLLVGVVGSNTRAATLEGLNADALTAAKGANPFGMVNEPVPGGPGYIMISPFQFKPYVSGDDSGYWLFQLYNPDAVTKAYATALILPDGAIITRMVVYYYSTTVTSLSVYLMLCAVDSNNCYYMAQVNTTNDGGISNKQDATIEIPEVDNQSYYYILEADFNGGAGINLRLMGVRLDYEIPSTTYLPMIVQ